MVIDDVLHAFENGDISLEDAKEQLQGFSDIGCANVDIARKKRNGVPEVIYGESKTVAQIQAISRRMLEKGEPVLITRLNAEKAGKLNQVFPESQYNATARIMTMNYQKNKEKNGEIAVVTAGTSDIAIAEEAAVTAEVLGNNVKRIYDVGVAGIHRLLVRLPDLKSANVIIVIAGMEGALASVVGGLVDVPVIAVPTSVGYGANFNGLSALLGMLNSCSSGVTVTNIDNGFGAAYSASMINQPPKER